MSTPKASFTVSRKDPSFTAFWIATLLCPAFSSPPFSFEYSADSFWSRSSAAARFLRRSYSQFSWCCAARLNSVRAAAMSPFDAYPIALYMHAKMRSCPPPSYGKYLSLSIIAFAVSTLLEKTDDLSFSIMMSSATSKSAIARSVSPARSWAFADISRQRSLSPFSFAASSAGSLAAAAYSPRERFAR